jgi:hypothetical protein
MTSPAETMKPMISARLWLMWPTRTSTVREAKVASATNTVSHPTNVRYERNPGRTFPFTPKAARERVMVGALERLPAIELTATRPKELIVPTQAATTACQKEILKRSRKRPP